MPPRRRTLGICESFDFSGGVIEAAKIAFSLKRLYGRIFFTEFGGTFCHYFLGQGENTPGKKTAETQSMKTQVNSGEIPVRKDVGKVMQNVGIRRLTPKSAKLICYPILKIQS